MATRTRDDDELNVRDLRRADKHLVGEFSPFSRDGTLPKLMSHFFSNSDAEVFISYASHDRSVVTKIVSRVESLGIKIWRDQDAILGGENFGLAIVQAIKSAKVLLLMCTNAAMRSKNVKQEIQLAWKHDIPYLPLLFSLA